MPDRLAGGRERGGRETIRGSGIRMGKSQSLDLWSRYLRRGSFFSAGLKVLSGGAGLNAEAQSTSLEGFFFGSE